MDILRIFLYFVGVALCFGLVVYNRPVKQNNTFVIVLLIFTAVIIGLTPETYSMATDKSVYMKMFENPSSDFRDIGLTYYINAIRHFSQNVWFWFVITAFLYVFGNYYFLVKAVGDKAIYLVIAVALSIGFFAYGVNTIRSGLALSLFLVAISKNQKTYLSIILLILSFCLHKSILLPIFIWIIGFKIQNTKIYLCTWVLALICQLIGIFEIQTFRDIAALAGLNDYYTHYFATEHSLYKVGLRLDFIAYSAIPIVMSTIYIFKNKILDPYYLRIANLYIGTNAIWLMFVRIPYTDRIAYLSWVLMPFVLLYPLLVDYKKYIPSRKFKIAIFTLMGGGISLLLSIIK